ncbi:hypothetical protein FRC04_010748 [Tulasnella sp. 424]|nr:hypothetical protein FRC04_010748 [Tulasnella sp. 424]KAG8969273.1 hypothetical protein FRC05_001132 [Tulasnella sp. 425]
MARINRGRGKTSRTTKNISDENKHSTDVPNGSGSHSLATPPVLDDNNHVAVWDPDASPIEASWGLPIDDWNNPQGDNTWEWEAAGDESIASDDPFKDKKLAWRKEHDHVYSSEHRVRRWREKLPVKRLLLSRTEDIETPVDSPPEAELWDGRSGCRLQSRERSRSRGRQGRNERRERAAVAEEWREKVEQMIAEGALAINDPDSFADSLPGTFSQDTQLWFGKLVKKPKWSHVKNSKAKAFFEVSLLDIAFKVSTTFSIVCCVCPTQWMAWGKRPDGETSSSPGVNLDPMRPPPPGTRRDANQGLFHQLSMREKISQVERLGRELANGPSWDI